MTEQQDPEKQPSGPERGAWRYNLWDVDGLVYRPLGRAVGRLTSKLMLLVISGGLGWAFGILNTAGRGTLAACLGVIVSFWFFAAFLSLVSRLPIWPGRRLLVPWTMVLPSLLAALVSFWIPVEKFAQRRAEGHQSAWIAQGEAEMHARMVEQTGYALTGVIGYVENLFTDTLALIGVALILVVALDIVKHLRQGGTLKDYPNHIVHRWDGAPGSGAARAFRSIFQPASGGREWTGDHEEDRKSSE